MNEDMPDMTDEGLQEFFKLLLNHTVAIAGTYQYTQDDEEDKPYAFSGCIVSSRDNWHVLTAGHAIKEHRIKSSKVIISSRVLADNFGADANDRHPIPFDPVHREARIVHIENGLDYAAFTLSKMECALLMKNGIKPFPLREHPLDIQEFDRYYIVGFPEEKTEAVSSLEWQSVVGVRPNAICIRPVSIAKSVATNGRLAFEIIDKGENKSIIGLSGGPVFGVIQNGANLQVGLIGIQSAWDEKSTAFVCAIEDIFNDWRQSQTN